MSSRRKFIIDCSAAAVTLAFACLDTVGYATACDPSVRSLEELSYAALSRHVNTIFRVRAAPSRTISLQLLKAPRADAPGVPNESFSLIFSGASNQLIEAAIHRFEHPCLGQFEMYIGPCGPHAGATVQYEAVFNRPARA